MKGDVSIYHYHHQSSPEADAREILARSERGTPAFPAGDKLPAGAVRAPLGEKSGRPGRLGFLPPLLASTPMTRPVPQPSPPRPRACRSRSPCGADPCSGPGSPRSRSRFSRRLPPPGAFGRATMRAPLRLPAVGRPLFGEQQPLGCLFWWSSRFEISREFPLDL